MILHIAFAVKCAELEVDSKLSRENVAVIIQVYFTTYDVVVTRSKVPGLRPGETDVTKEM